MDKYKTSRLIETVLLCIVPLPNNVLSAKFLTIVFHIETQIRDNN